jgi:hypothetical protein
MRTEKIPPVTPTDPQGEEEPEPEPQTLKSYTYNPSLLERGKEAFGRTETYWVEREPPLEEYGFFLAETETREVESEEEEYYPSKKDGESLDRRGTVIEEKNRVPRFEEWSVFFLELWIRLWGFS